MLDLKREQGEMRLKRKKTSFIAVILSIAIIFGIISPSSVQAARETNTPSVDVTESPEQTEETENEPDPVPDSNDKKDDSSNKKPKIKDKKTKRNKSASTPKSTTISPSATYKPIIGKRVVYSKGRISVKKKSLYANVEKAKKSKDKISIKMKRKENYLNALQSLIDKVNQKDTSLFINNNSGSCTLKELARYDKSMKPYASYSLVTGAEGLIDAYKNLSTTDNVAVHAQNAQNESSYTVHNSQSSHNMITKTSSIKILNSMNTGAIDIGEYLEYSYDIQNNGMHKLYKKLKKSKSDYMKAYNKYISYSECDIVIFNPKDITELSGITKKQMAYVLKGTNLEQYAGTYVEIEKKYGINAIAICSLSALESNWGRSRRAIQDHNYTGFGVYSDSSVGINSKSGKDNLMMTAKHLANNYVIPGSKYYSGKGLDGVNKKYAASRTWAFGIEHIGYRLMERLKTYK